MIIQHSLIINWNRNRVALSRTLVRPHLLGASSLPTSNMFVLGPAETRISQTHGHVQLLEDTYNHGRGALVSQNKERTNPNGSVIMGAGSRFPDTASQASSLRISSFGDFHVGQLVSTPCIKPSTTDVSDRNRRCPTFPVRPIVSLSHTVIFSSREKRANCLRRVDLYSAYIIIREKPGVMCIRLIIAKSSLN